MFYSYFVAIKNNLEIFLESQQITKPGDVYYYYSKNKFYNTLIKLPIK